MSRAESLKRSILSRIWKAFHIRGKIARLFRTWLESEYHRSSHRGLQGATPLGARIEKAKHIITIDPTVDL